MSNAMKVQELMVKITEYPHIPYWLSVRDAISMIHSAYDEKTGDSAPRMVLVFDEKYQLQGILTLKSLLMGIEPRFLRKDEKSHYQGLANGDPASLSALVEGTFAENCKAAAAKPVKEVMIPIRVTLDVNDSVVKAAFVMLQEGVDLVPVMDGDKVAGVLRMTDVFNELTKIVIE